MNHVLNLYFVIVKKLFSFDGKIENTENTNIPNMQSVGSEHKGIEDQLSLPCYSALIQKKINNTFLTNNSNYGMVNISC